VTRRLREALIIGEQGALSTIFCCIGLGSAASSREAF
jgi:hypothetical protein